MDRKQIELRVEALRAEHPGREEFVAAIRAFGEDLDAEARKTLGRVLLDREPETGGFDAIDEHEGWVRRTMRRIEERGRFNRLGRE